MIRWSRVFASLLAVLLCVSLLPAAVLAEEAPAEDPAPEGAFAENACETGEIPASDGATAPDTVRGAGKTAFIMPGGGGDEDALFAGYIAALFYGDGYAPAPALDGASGGYASLSGIEALVYDRLRVMIEEVAAGERTSTVFEIPIAELGMEKTSWTAAELGIPAIADDDGAITAEAMDAAFPLPGERIVNALLADCPYSLYWYDKIAETEYYGPDFSADHDGGEYVMTVGGSLFFSCPVAAGYAADTYTVDPAGVQRAGAAAQKARDIVSKYADVSDHDKLLGYKNEICALASYNNAAAEDDDTPYGDPWQLVYVFDGDPATQAVCEGYAKAFQYLCDLTAFSGDIVCRTVTGTMEGGTGEGPHMWNLVKMEDGRNYLVDVTNCDEGTIGAPDQLFLRARSSGSVEEGYGFICNDGVIRYAYDDLSLPLYGTDALTVSPAAYGTEAPSAGTSVALTAENFPDAAFLAYLRRTFDQDGDGLVSVDEVTVIDLSSAPDISCDITSVQGVGLFTELQQLYIFDNGVTELDLRDNPKLDTLYCRRCRLASIDISNNPELRWLICDYNELTELDVSHNPELIDLACYNNLLTELDVSRNPALTILECGNNLIDVLDVSSNTRLTCLEFADLPISSLDVTCLPELEELLGGYNELTEIDLTHNPKLGYIILDHNHLSELDLSGNPLLYHLCCGQNDLTELDLSHNPKLNYVGCSVNPLLRLDVSCLPELEGLGVHMCGIKELDVSHNPKLEELVCSNNLLTDLDLTHNPKLDILNCYWNCFTELDLSANPLLVGHVNTQRREFESDTIIKYSLYNEVGQYIKLMYDRSVTLNLGGGQTIPGEGEPRTLPDAHSAAAYLQYSETWISANILRAIVDLPAYKVF